uniref:Uncharacterized protein n=1 Tax=Trieres chinensis TaxID=1514140 RepID=A0A7S1YTA8_TRICV|mmetsp:Transcript_10214/g.21515  ORF Transcript_10214/g.21515 Transcript_10214/m.21515 type:complete len:311 (+) Transcript_10214:253-1185(+)
MLAADKLQLQSALKQQATALKEKEFNLHHSNLMTVGTQAAVLAGLDVTMFIEFQPPHNDEWGDAYMVARTLKFFYYLLITSAFCCNIMVVGQSTVLSVLGSSLALRGPDGSMMTATDGLYEERKSVFHAFGYGLGLTVGSVIICVWILLSPEASVVCMSVTTFTIFKMYTNYLRVVRRFDFDENETVDFSDIFEGPAAIQAIPTNAKKWIRGNYPGRNVTDKQLIKEKYSGKSLACSDDLSSSGGDSTATEDGANTKSRGNAGKSSRNREKTRRRRRSPSVSSQHSRLSDWQNDMDIERGREMKSLLQTV